MTRSVGIEALHELRRTRRRNRLADLEWFEAAYRVYLVAIVAGAAVLYLSDLIGDEPLSVAQGKDLLRHGPSALGVAAAVALAWGLRSGSQGGPIAIEEADVRHVLLSPVSRRRALLRPAWQSIRSAVFMCAVVGAIAGQLAGRRAPGSVMAWGLGGALFGGVIGLLASATALLTHGLRVPRWLATSLGLAIVAGQLAAARTRAPSPLNLIGDLGLWGWRERLLDVPSIVAVVALAAASLALLDGISVEALTRRSGLIAQLRFAVTMQDLRTVVLLRRQLGQERTRARPWFRLRRAGRSPAVWRRGWHSLLRFPLPRLLRLALLAAIAATCQIAVYRGTTPAVLGTGLALFVLGLDVLEPLSQEVDQPDRTDAFPMARGALMMRHLAAPALALVPIAAVGVAVAFVWRREPSTIAVAGALAVPVILAGAAGAVVSVVLDAPDPVDSTRQQSMLPPEIGGITTTLRLAIPLAISAASGLPVLGVRAAARDGASVIDSVVRSVLGLVLLLGTTVAWVRKRDDVRRAVRAFLSEGRAAAGRQSDVKGA